jgi:hypothetical protein
MGLPENWTSEQPNTEGAYWVKREEAKQELVFVRCWPRFYGPDKPRWDAAQFGKIDTIDLRAPWFKGALWLGPLMPPAD